MSRYVVLLSCLLGASPAFAGTVVCTGTVDYLQYDSNDKFAIKLSTMNQAVYFCTPQGTWTVTAGYSTGSETCKMMYASFLAAKLAGIPVGAVYFDGDGVPATCDAWAAWQSASIRHFVVE